MAELARLPAEEQEEFGRWVLAELATERRWDDRTRGSQTALARLAAETRAAIVAGQATELDPSKM